MVQQQQQQQLTNPRRIRLEYTESMDLGEMRHTRRAEEEEENDGDDDMSHSSSSADNSLTAPTDESLASDDRHNHDTKTAPRGFICPLTMEVMFDPVLDADGNTYERSALLAWLREQRSSPISRHPLTDRMIIPNNALRDAIHEFMGKVWVAHKTREHNTLHDDMLADHGQQNQQQQQQQQQGKRMGTYGERLRARMDCYLQHTSRELGGLQLQLNAEGCCAFRYDDITVVIDVPDKVGVFCLYTRDLVPDYYCCNDSSIRKEMYRRALELNFLQGETRGGCLSIRQQNGGMEDEIMFSYTDRVPEVAAQDFSNILLNFVETAVMLKAKLRPDVRPKDKARFTTSTSSRYRTPSSLTAPKFNASERNPSYTS